MNATKAASRRMTTVLSRVNYFFSDQLRKQTSERQKCIKIIIHTIKISTFFCGYHQVQENKKIISYEQNGQLITIPFVFRDFKAEIAYNHLLLLLLLIPHSNQTDQL